MRAQQVAALRTVANVALIVARVISTPADWHPLAARQQTPVCRTVLVLPRTASVVDVVHVIVIIHIVDVFLLLIIIITASVVVVVVVVVADKVSRPVLVDVIHRVLVFPERRTELGTIVASGNKESAPVRHVVHNIIICVSQDVRECRSAEAFVLTHFPERCAAPQHLRAVEHLIHLLSSREVLLVAVLAHTSRFTQAGECRARAGRGEREEALDTRWTGILLLITKRKALRRRRSSLRREKQECRNTEPQADVPCVHYQRRQ